MIENFKWIFSENEDDRKNKEKLKLEDFIKE